MDERLKWQRQGHPRAFIECALQVGDFGDAINWPTPGEIAHKSVQVSLRKGMGRMELCLHLHIWLFKLSELQVLRGMVGTIWAALNYLSVTM